MSGLEDIRELQMCYLLEKIYKNSKFVYDIGLNAGRIFAKIGRFYSSIFYYII